MTFNGLKLPLKRYRSLGILATASAVGLLSGCLDRPVGKTQPETNNIFVTKNPSGGIDKIDILFMIDNSLSMGDKQAVLAAAVPQLLQRLTKPDCVNSEGKDRQASVLDASNTATCPAGSNGEALNLEFAPVKDIHIGVVTSSLGDYGGDACPETVAEDKTNGFPDQNDHGWLLGALPRVASAGLDASGFLSWTKDDAKNYGTAIQDKVKEFRNFVTAAGEIGCGLEMSLESWYRFLVDPAPPMDVVNPSNYNVSPWRNADCSLDAVKAGTCKVDALSTGLGDPTIRALRKAFLRSDSLVAVVMLTDENDCSLKDSNSASWVPAKMSTRMFPGSKQCTENGPNDPCCFSCMLTTLDPTIPQACKDADPACTPNTSRLTLPDDSPTLRCLHMKARFGFDFLFPVKRYANALTQQYICPERDDLDCTCGGAENCKVTKVLNPLYDNLDTSVVPTGPDRADPSAVFFAGIVGVPWQDLVTAEVLPDGVPLEYKAAKDLNWDLFAPADDVTAPLDPLMVEQSAPRTGTHPITGEALAPVTAARRANSINGHEWNPGTNDIQFACTFSLEQQIEEGKTTATRDCVNTAYKDGYCKIDPTSRECLHEFQGCSCNGVDPTKYTANSPLCQAADGTYSTTQTYAKAYPGIRELQALRQFYDITKSPNAIVASICPKDLTYSKQTESGYGYNPAVAALVNSLKEKLTGTCLPRALTVTDEGDVPCKIVEVIPNANNANSGWCACPNRDPVEEGLQKAIIGALTTEGVCGGTGQPACTDYCFCGLKQLKKNDKDSNLATAATQCLDQANTEKSAAAPGFCYVDPSQGVGSPEIVASCPSSEKRLIRIVGTGIDYGAAPAPGLVFIACSGAPYKESDGTGGSSGQ